jgi:tRNA A37 threonylcarbamoyladenosine synthetase subunit TsaC/SUA5/YrdC
LRGFDALLDGGTVKKGVESTIVDILDSTAPRVVREGAIASKEIYRMLATTQ